MKIIYLHQYFNTPAMVGGTRSYEMARRLAAAGHEVHVITSLRIEGGLRNKWIVTSESGVSVHWYPVPYSNKLGFYKRIFAFLRFAWVATKRAVQLRGQLVFATSTPLTIALPGVWSARIGKIPFVFEVRDLWPEMPIAMGVLKNPVICAFAKWLERWAYKNAEVVIALSQGMRDGIVRSGVSVDRVVVIPNGSDNDFFLIKDRGEDEFMAKRPWLDGYPLLVYTGTFGRVNAVSYMVDLARELMKLGSNVRILLIGEGIEKDDIVSAAEQWGVLGKNLFIENEISKMQMPAVLAASTMASNLVVDIPAAFANSANKFFDALAAGRPILLNHGGWMSDLVRNENCGLVVWKLTTVEAAKLVDSKMNDSEWLTKAGAAARALAEKNFSRDSLAATLLEVMERVVGVGNDDRVGLGKTERARLAQKD